MGDNRERGLVTKSDHQSGEGLIREGGLIELLWYFQVSIDVNVTFGFSDCY